MERAFGFARLLTTAAPAPLAAVRVKVASTQEDATIYANDGVTLKANPFTADANGYWFFYAANGRYDVTITPASGGNAYTEADHLLYDNTD